MHYLDKIKELPAFERIKIWLSDYLILEEIILPPPKDPKRLEILEGNIATIIEIFQKNQYICTELGDFTYQMRTNFHWVIVDELTNKPIPHFEEATIDLSNIYAYNALSSEGIPVILLLSKDGSNLLMAYNVTNQSFSKLLEP